MIASDSRSSSSIPVRYYFISLLLPLSVLLVLRAVPQIDLNFNDPAAHFYIVTAISFSGITLAGLANSLSHVSGRAQVLFVSLGLFSVAGLLFIHGLATPNALLVSQTPGSGWAAKLSLTAVGIFLILSGIPWRSSINDLLIKRERTRQDIAKVVTNNVQRPMSTLARSIDQLQRSALPPEEIELVSRNRSHAREVNNTVYNLLNISEMENGELHVQQSTFSIDELLHINVQDSAETAHEAEVNVGTEARPGLSYVWADRELINRVINNLLDNAITHTPPGGQVVLNADAGPDGNIIVRVKDQGEGIAREDQAHIFEKFARIGGESVSDGTGLGLAFCKLAVEQHQGRIWVESEPGQSSTFSFTLPTLTTATAI